MKNNPLFFLKERARQGQATGYPAGTARTLKSREQKNAIPGKPKDKSGPQNGYSC